LSDWIGGMDSLSETKDLEAIRSSWIQVFETNEPFQWPFQQHFEAGRLFYPTDGYHLTEEQYRSIVAASRAIGEDALVLSIVESENLEFLDRTWGHWAGGIPSYSQYVELPLTLENALYSRNGEWGVLISHEMHALVSGSERFLAALGREYSAWSSDLRLLREAWSNTPNNEWVESTVSHCQTQKANG